MALPVGVDARFKVPAWTLQRAAAINALKGETDLHHEASFMKGLKWNFPSVTIDGALPATGLGWHDAKSLHRFVDVVVLWGFGDFNEETGCSSYYDQRSPWYNGFYGGYAMRSHKGGNVAWGYDKDGNVKFDELFEICAIDYNFLTAGAFGCPFEKMSFAVNDDFRVSKVDKWDVVDVYAVAPSGLQSGKTPPGDFFDLSSYVVFGILIRRCRTERTFPLYRLPASFTCDVAASEPPITLAWGAACQTLRGRESAPKIMTAMKKEYSKL